MSTRGDARHIAGAGRVVARLGGIGCLVLLLGAAQVANPKVVVEVFVAEEGSVLPMRETQALEDAVAAAFSGADQRLETRRARMARAPPAVYAHAQALNACANPRWSKARVMRCLDGVTFPSPPFRPARFVRATHQLRILRATSAEGETLTLTLTSLGRSGDENNLRRVLPRDTTASERRAAVLDLAAQLLGGIMPEAR